VMMRKTMGRDSMPFGAKTPTRKVPATLTIELMKSMMAEALDLSSAFESAIEEALV